MSSTDDVAGPAEKRVSTGVPGLDLVLNGGLPEDHLYLVEGDPGAGKTTLALQFLRHAHGRGEPVLYVTLSESVRELRAIANSHGWSLDGIELLEVIPPPESLLPEDQYTVFHPGEVELGNTLKGILERVEQTKPTRAVFDSLSELRLLSRDAARYRRQILGLKQFFESRHCATLLLDDRPRQETADTAVLSIVHGVIRLERVAREYGAKRRRLEVVKLRGVMFHDGYHEYTIQTGGIVVYPRLAAVQHEAESNPSGSASGIAELDELLGGGLDRGTSTLIAGPAGSGKSSVALQYAAALAGRGEKAAIYLFDEGLTTLFQRARGLGVDLEACVADGNLHIRQLDPAELGVGEFIHTIRRAVVEDGLRLVVIDTLNGFLNAMPGEHYLIVQLHELLSFLNQHGVVTILVLAQYGILGAGMESPVDISYLADTVILLRYFEAAGRVRKAISVVKKRSGAHEDTVRELRIGPGRVTLGAPLSQFQGVLSGTPLFTGNADRLMDLNEHR